MGPPYVGLVANLENVPLKNIKINCAVTNLLVNVTTEFLYANASNNALEAKFVFPLNAVSVYYFEAKIEDRKIVAQCRPREEAKETYEEAVGEGHAAFLAEQDEHCDDVFVMSVGNIPPNGTVSILLKYVGLLEARNVRDGETSFSHSEATFTLPSVLNPRFTPSERKIEGESALPSFPVAINSIPYSITFGARLRMPSDIVGVFSVHDHFELIEDPNSKCSAAVKLVTDFKPDHDLQMVIKLNKPFESSVACEVGNSKTYGLLSMNCCMVQFLPILSATDMPRETRNEIVFLIDRSGSMSGNNIEQARRSLLLFLKSLPTDCRFQIIGFGNTHASLFNEPMDYSESTLNRALEYQKNLKADMGGTCVYPALSAAFTAPLTGQGWFRQIIFLTDGDVGNADEIIGLVQMNVTKARVFAIGLGEGASTTLVSGIARAGRGTADFVRHGSQLQSVVMRILQSALQPRASDVKLEWNLFETDLADKQVEVLTVPKAIPPVFCGQFLTCFGLFEFENPSNITGQVTLSYDMMGKKETVIVDMASAITRENVLQDPDLPLHRLAAKFQIQEYMDCYNSLMLSDSTNFSEPKQDNKESKDLRKQIEHLSCNVNIISKFTSLVGVDPVKQDGNKEIITVTVPRMRRMERLFGAPRGYATPVMGLGSNFCFGLTPCTMLGFSANRAAADAAPPPVFHSARPNFLSPMHEKSAQGQTDSPPEKHLQLADLQDFDGSWKLNQSLADCFEVSLGQVESHQSITWQTEPPSSITDSVWATVLCIAFLELHVADKEQEWILMVEKAKIWLSKQVPKQNSTNVKSDIQLCKDLIETAKNLLKNLMK